MNDGNAFGFQKLGDEVLVRLDDLARRRGLADQAGAGRVDVEGTFRRRAGNALSLVQHRNDEIAPGLRYYEQTAPWPHDDHALALHDIRPEPAKRSDLLAFDTETTGLAGGTGTRAFMIGAADFVDGALRIRQLCITTLGAERAMLKTFSTWLRPETVLVSYNGRSYDRPLLTTRYRLARLRDPLIELRHLDLLHPVRRRYRGVWANCKLATVERELLGVLREDDLPGSEAPAAWLNYLRGGSADKLRRVGLHNAQDLRSLFGLLEAMRDAAVVDTVVVPDVPMDARGDCGFG